MRLPRAETQLPGGEWPLTQVSPALSCTSQRKKEPPGILDSSGMVSSSAWGKSAQIVEAVAVPERCWVLPPHAGLPYHPGWMLSHSRKWVQGYPHAKLLIVSQIVSFPEGFIKNITMAFPVCPRSNTSKLQMQDSQSEKCLRASEKIWGITLALQCYSKKKN